MRAQEKDRAYARKLLELSHEGDRIVLERVDAVIAYLREKQPSRHLKILREYGHLVERALTFSNALLESAGEVDSATLESIEKTLSTRYGRSVSAEVRQNPDLIAGIRIHIGDDVWDDSVAIHLENLKANV